MTWFSTSRKLPEWFAASTAASSWFKATRMSDPVGILQSDTDDIDPPPVTSGTATPQALAGIIQQDNAGASMTVATGTATASSIRGILRLAP